MAADCIKQSNGFASSVSDAEILKAQKEFILKTGVLCKPSSATTYAAFKNLRTEAILEDKSLLLLNTGNDLKDIKSMQNL